jgi:hypothetical protein
MHDGYLHEQTSLTTRSIPNYDQLSTDFRHLDGVEVESVQGRLRVVESGREWLDREKG